MKQSVIHRSAAVAVTCAIVSAGSIGVASAEVCTLSFPIQQQPCGQGTSRASVTHRLEEGQPGISPPFFLIGVDMEGGSTVALAYGIDESGNHLNTCETTAADSNPFPNRFTGVPCNVLYGGTDDTLVERITTYDHPVDMAATFVVSI
jgi:hypothetical protein